MTPKKRKSLLGSRVSQEHADSCHENGSTSSLEPREVWGSQKLLETLLSAISSGEFISGHTVYSLARDSGHTILSVNKHLAQARATMLDRISAEERRHILTACLETCSARALQAGMYGDAIRGYSEIAKLHGLVEKKHMIVQASREMSPAQELEYIQKLKQDVLYAEQCVIEAHGVQVSEQAHVSDEVVGTGLALGVGGGRPIAGSEENVEGPGEPTNSENLEKTL